jgi:2-polyprenyl-6-hydroxyphenyl methylase/3-demethylubiquinone-9 3-methyltransferase
MSWNIPFLFAKKRDRKKFMKNQYKWSEAELSSTLKLLLPEIEKNILTKISKKSLLLDAGCGTGYLPNWLGRKGFSAYGVDGSRDGIKLAKKNKNKKTKFICSNIEKLKYKFSNTFDCVFLTEVIEHVFSPRDLLSTIESVTKKNGYVFISTPYHGYFKNLLIALLGKFDEHFTVLWDFGHIKFFSKKTLTKMILENNFEIVHYKAVGRFFLLWKSMFFILKKK